MTKPVHLDAEEARDQLPKLLDDAAGGRTTIIMKGGRPVAALVPARSYLPAGKQRSLLALEGSGCGLWGEHSRDTLKKLREDWDR